jgi:hypothetical protein
MKTTVVCPSSMSTSDVRGFSDADIARVIGERKAFVGLVRQGELPLTLDHVELMPTRSVRRSARFCSPRCRPGRPRARRRQPRRRHSHR